LWVHQSSGYQGYLILQEHCNNAVSSKKEVEALDNAIDIFDAIENADRDIYVKSVKKTKRLIVK
jgi:pyruvate/2-oxoglutarate/acetoin dehydrogenase E1 component